MGLALDESGVADEVDVVREVDGKPDPGLERINLIVELGASEDEAGLDAENVERLQPQTV